MAQKQKHGPGVRKAELERRLDANSAAVRSIRRDEGDPAEVEGSAPVQQQSSGRGHKAQQAPPHRSGRPSGGNVTGGKRDEALDQ